MLPSLGSRRIDHERRTSDLRSTRHARSLRWLVLLGISVAVVGAVALPLVVGAVSWRPADRLEAPAAGEPAGPIGEPPMIDVTIEVQPETAEIWIDGVAAEGNPFTARFVRDGLEHDIRASAPGYTAASHGLLFAGHITLKMILQHRKTEGGVAARAPAETEQPTQSPKVAGAKLLRRGQELYGIYQYRPALDHFQEAYAIGHSLEALYYVGMTHGRLDRFPDALLAFEKWLSEADPTALHRIEIEQTIGRLKQRIAEKARWRSMATGDRAR